MPCDLYDTEDIMCLNSYDPFMPLWKSCKAICFCAEERVPHISRSVYFDTLGPIRFALDRGEFDPQHTATMIDIFNEVLK